MKIIVIKIVLKKNERKESYYVNKRTYQTKRFMYANCIRLFLVKLHLLVFFASTNLYLNIAKA